MSDPSPCGRFVWHELMAADPESAARFYAKIVGWKTQTWPQDPSYTLFTLGKTPKAGLIRLPEDARQMGVPPHWLTYVGTSNVDETLRQAESLGAANLHGPVDIPNTGRFVVLRDPQGAVFAIYTPAAGQPSGHGEPAVGEFSWHELATSDWQAAMAFYQALFGWERTGSMDMPEGPYVMFGIGGQPMGGVFTKPAAMPGPPSWLPYIKVADSHRAAAAAGKHGGSIVNGPMEVPGGDWIAQGLDPQGAMFAVHSAKAVPAAAPAEASAAAAPPKPVTKASARRTAAPHRQAAKSAKKVTAQAAQKKTAPKKAATKKAATKKAATKKAAPKKSAPKKAAPKKSVRSAPTRLAKKVAARAKRGIKKGSRAKATPRPTRKTAKASVRRVPKKTAKVKVVRKAARGKGR